MKVLLEVTLEEAQEFREFQQWKTQHAALLRCAEQRSEADDFKYSMERAIVEGRREQLLDIEDNYDRINRWRY